MENHPSQEHFIHQNKIRQIFFLVILALLGVLLVKEFMVFLPAFLGAVTLYILMRRPMIYLVQQRKWSKNLSVWMLILLSFLVIMIPIGALIGMAAHLENKGGSVLDQTGLAQKGGAVTTHVRIAKTPDDIHAVRIAAGEADLVLGCDMVVVNDYWALSKIRAERSHMKGRYRRWYMPTRLLEPFVAVQYMLLAGKQ